MGFLISGVYFLAEFVNTSSFLTMLKTILQTLTLSCCLYTTSLQLPFDPPHTSEYTCLLSVLYSEARGEPIEGIRAVASVVLNRRDHPSLYPRTICGVVLQKAQFTNVEHTHRKALNDPRSLQNDKGYTNIARVAYEALYEGLDPSVTALDYHAVNHKVYWSKYLREKKVIGKHVFGKVRKPK